MSRSQRSEGFGRAEAAKQTRRKTRRSRILEEQAMMPVRTM